MKRLFLLLIIILLACSKKGNENTSAGNSITISKDSIKVIEKYFQVRHNQMKTYYDSLIYKFTPTVLSQEQLMRMTESPTLYKMYKYFDNRLNENIAKHGEIILEFHNKMQERFNKNKTEIPASLLGKYFKLEEFYYKEFYKVAEKYKKWIYERRTNVSKQA